MGWDCAARSEASADRDQSVSVTMQTATVRVSVSRQLVRACGLTSIGAHIDGAGVPFSPVGCAELGLRGRRTDRSDGDQRPALLCSPAARPITRRLIRRRIKQDYRQRNGVDNDAHAGQRRIQATDDE